MEWGRLYANLPDDPRVQAAEDNDGAGWLIVQSFCYCTRAESGGFIPHTQIPRFGGARLKQRVAALVRERIWQPTDGGYVLDPDIWSEERNLSDSAERKRKKDRERIAAKRAAAKAAQNGQSPDMSRDMSRDSSATPGATCPRDSRAPEKRRRYNPPLPPPQRPALRVVADAQAGEGEESGQAGQPSEADVAAFVAVVRKTRPAWSSHSIKRALTSPDVLERGWDLVQRAMLAVAADPESRHPGRLAADGDWWFQPASAAPPPRTERCPIHQQDYAAGSECRGCAADRKAAS